MELYIEYVLIDNLVVNFAIFSLMEISFGKFMSARRKILISLLGGVFSLVLPILYNENLLMFAYKVVVSIIMVLCIKKYKNILQFFKYYLMLWTYTFVVGGVIIGVISLIGIDYTMSNLIIYNCELPMGILLMIVIAGVYIIKYSLRIIKKDYCKNKYIYSIELKEGGVRCKANAYWDSGNNVVYNGQGVSIITFGLFSKLYKNCDLGKVYSEKWEDCNLKNPQFILIEGLGGGGKYLSFEIEQIKLNDKIVKDIRVAVTLKAFEGYECILYKDLVR